MAVLYGKNYSRQELLDRVGDISQIAGAKEVSLVGGFHDGVTAVEFRTGSGLNFTAVPSRGLDITIAQYNGKSLSWRSAAGEVGPAFYEEPGVGWLRSFAGGLVTTCGLTYVGACCQDDGMTLGAHGRHSSTPASNVWVDGEWDGDDYRFWAMGKMRESRLFGENVVLKRKVSAALGQNKIWIDDVVTNEGPRQIPHMYLYHINGGFPAVDAGSIFISPTKDYKPRDVNAEVDKEHYYINDAPTEGFKERCYYHDMGTDKDGFVYAALVNKNMPDGSQFGFYVKYNKNELPRFTQWKMNGTREYVVGMEPANCWVEGRAKERERGTLQFLEPGETRKYSLEFGVLADADDVAAMEQIIQSLK